MWPYATSPAPSPSGTTRGSTSGTKRMPSQRSPSSSRPTGRRSPGADDRFGVEHGAGRSGGKVDEGLSELLFRGADPVGVGFEGGQVEAVDLGGVARGDLLELRRRDPAEGPAQGLPGVREGALVVGEVAAPHEAAYTDLVAERDFGGLHERGADEAVPGEVLRGFQ